MIKLRKLTLENFLSHRETEIEFGDETYVILGDNASGKTSILRGIFFAIFGEDLKEKTSREQLINRRANASKLSLEFVHRGSLYRVERELSRKRNSAKLEKDGKLIARGIREVKNFISESLGFSPEMFKNTVFVPQGEIVELLKGRPQERRKILNRLLGLEEFGKKHEELKEEIKRLKGFENFLVTKFSALEGTGREIEEQKLKREKLKEEIRALEEEVSELTEKLNRGKRDFEELRKVKEEFERLKREIEGLKSSREKAERRAEELERKLKEIDEKKRKLPALKEELKLLKPCEELYSLTQELKPIVVEKERLERELQKLKEGVELRKKLETEIPGLRKELSQIEKEIGKLTEERKRAEEEVSRLKDSEKIHRELSVKSSSLKERLERIKRELPAVSREEVERVRRESERLERESENLRAKRERLLKELTDVEERLKLLKRETTECPVCGGELPPEKRELLLSESERELLRIREELKKTEERLGELKGEIENLKPRLEKLKELLIEREKGEKEIERIEGELRSIRLPDFKEEELREKEKLLERKREEIARLEREKARVETKLSEAEKQVEKLPGEEELRAAEKRMEELLKSEEGIRNRIREIKERAGLTVSSFSQLKQLIEELREKQKELKEIEGELKSEGKFRELLSETGRELEELKRRETETEERLKKLNFSESIYTAAENSLKLIEDELKKKSERLNRLFGELKGTEENLKRLEEKKGELEKVRRSLAKVRDSLFILQKVQESVHPERGFLKDVRTMLLPRIAHYCKEFFEAFDFEFGDLFISEDLSVEFGMPGQGTMLIEDLSGGQQVAFALALRFAMARNFSQSMELLVLDEPTVHLDAQRRMGLTELLLKLKSRIPQMLIVTHDPELEVAGDRVIRVKNHGGYSVVESGV